MKINLDQEEIAALLIDWAKKKYKTHNVNVDFSAKVFAVLELILTNDQLTDNTSSSLDTAFMDVKRRVFAEGYQQVQNDTQPEFNFPIHDVTPLV